MKPQILRDLRFLFSLVVACCPAGVPGAGGPGRCVCRWAAARPRAVHAASFARRVASKPGQAPPPPTGTAARPRHRPSISHVIPLRLVQTLNLRRWNCNVFGVSRKMTAINYVRNMGGGDVLAPVGTAARPRASKPGQAPPPPTGTAADPSGALHTSGDWSLMCYWVRCFEARPGPAPRRVPYPQFRMQFPDTCSSSLSEKPGISTITFQSMKCAWGNCMRICADQAPPPPTGTAAWPAASWGRHGGLAC